MSVQRVGMAMIVRDEAAIIERCLTSFVDHVDQVAVLDTGCTDETMDIVRRIVPKEKLQTGVFKWCDDFAAARAAADELLNTEWRSWIDADDVLFGAEQLRPIANNANPMCAGFVADYDYAQAADGTCTCRLRRERIVRAGAGSWVGRVHEAQIISGPVEYVPSQLLEWRHRADDPGESSKRNLRILNAWEQAEPDNPRVLAYLGRENAARGNHKDAIGFFERYISGNASWDDERAQIHRQAAQSLLAVGEIDRAEQIALQGITVSPDWPDSYLTLAEVAHERKDWAKAIAYARRVETIGVPETLLIINPLDYAALPHVIQGSANAGLQNWQLAVEHAHKALMADAGREDVKQGLQQWQSMAERDRLAQMLVEMSQALVGHDEQGKALLMLESTAAYFIQDHPLIVTARSQLRERLLWVNDPAAYAKHYETGGSKPEDMVENYAEVCEHLPRAQFLLGGLKEQLKAAA